MKLVKALKIVLLYLVGIFFLIQAGFGFTVSLKAAIPIMLCSILSFPFVHKFLDCFLEKRSKRPIKWWVYLIAVFVLFCIGMSNWPVPGSTENNPMPESTIENQVKDNENEDVPTEAILSGASEQENEEAVASDIDGIMEKLLSIGFQQREAEEIKAIMLECGIENIDFLEPADTNANINGLASYRVRYDKDKILTVTFDQRKLYYIGLNGTDIYDSENGGFLTNVKDVHIPETDMTEMQKISLRDKTESVLDKYFKYTPYYDAWGFARQDDNYMVQCEAYAKNDLGISKYVPVRVWYIKDGNEYTLTGIRIDREIIEIQ